MRLWSIHPKYLDRKGLVALWREAILARAVLQGKTKGYRNHPQLSRFLQVEKPLFAINTYLFYIYREAKSRGYRFDESKLGRDMGHLKIPVTNGQVEFELYHLKKKCTARCPSIAKKLEKVRDIETNPLFYIVEGDVESWERV